MQALTRQADSARLHLRLGELPFLQLVEASASPGRLFFGIHALGLLEQEGDRVSAVCR